ncbi:phosphoenolpyruvate--protein phosphotransferase [Shewanella avicenniae]|uniref:Phosphoenolpyruvate-protein phosphotransferase n=1 Tax=Shewanella avicenniae TaxID=2814294 RepID=A0ABX7QKY7_9GAMM|nr:phosphoenolpyruvate--protein phosphotransferase [Shewanella avicenniae]QSX32049.1 phosphoenolpyruvate--protein phosphotransferase [Shewanella avicenniae]
MEVKGIAVSTGIAEGNTVLFEPFDNSLDYRLLPLYLIPSEQRKASDAIQQHCDQLEQSLGQLDVNSDNYALIEADLLLLQDPELTGQILGFIRDLQLSATAAVERVFLHHASELAALDDPLMAQRADDVESLCRRIISVINGAGGKLLGNLPADSILLAEDLTPSEFAQLPLDRIKGIVLKTGGLTSHTAILARAAGIPALLSCSFEFNQIAEGIPVVIDAYSGQLYIAPDAATYAELMAKKQQDDHRRHALSKYRDFACETRDHHRIQLMANITSINDVARLTQTGIDGIGLFRTEFLLMDATRVPDEKAQFTQYYEALHLLKGKTITIRTLDIGADKEFACLPHGTHEDNPALGMRGVRYSLQHKGLLRSQLRAVLRVAEFGKVRLMFPMVTQPEELDELLTELILCKQQLQLEGKKFGELQLGIVVETPAAVLNLPSMLGKLDFISIGSNDLAQYTLAADRTNLGLAANYPAFCPAVLQLINMTIQAAKHAGVSCSLCGEMASDRRIAPILVGMGLDELSINPAAVPEVKALLCEGNYQEFCDLARQALACSRINELESLLVSCKLPS